MTVPSPEQFAQALYEHEGNRWEKLQPASQTAKINAARGMVEVLAKLQSEPVKVYVAICNNHPIAVASTYEGAEKANQRYEETAQREHHHGSVRYYNIFARTVDAQAFNE